MIEMLVNRGPVVPRFAWRMLIGLSLLLAMPGIASAQDVILRTKDGAFEIRGTLIDDSDGRLTIESSMGQVRIPADQVVCIGDACPASLRPPAASSDEKAAGTGPAGSDVVTIGVAPNLPDNLLQALLAAYSKQPGVEIVASDNNRNWSIRNSAGRMTLTISAAEKSDLLVEFAGLADAKEVQEVLALDPIVAITAPSTRPVALSFDDLAAIFSGSQTDWSGMNSRGGKIVPVLPEADRIVDQVLRSDILGEATRSESVVTASDVQGVLLSTPGAIALVRGSAKKGLRATPISGGCGLTSDAGAFATKSGQYPLVRRVVLRTTRTTLPGALQDLIEFAVSDAGQDAMVSAGLTSQSIVRASEDWQADWIASAVKLSEFVGGGAELAKVLQELVETTANASRLSITLRYSSNGDVPDATAEGDFTRLAAAISSGLYDGNEILFLGYTDAGTAVTTGRRSSVNAANRVLRDFVTAYPAMLARPSVKFSATGFGGVAPLVCSGTTAERTVNQRVEVWIRPL